MRRRAATIKGKTITNIGIEDDGLIFFELSDDTVLSVWCDEERNAPGAMFSHDRVSGDAAIVISDARE